MLRLTPTPEAYACRISIRLRGVINREGAALFARLVEKLAEQEAIVTQLVLDSGGGDAQAAIYVGRLVRESPVFSAAPVTTRISNAGGAVCFSACVVVLAAGYHRELEFDIEGDSSLPSRIGIHGPGQFDREAGRYDSSAGNRDIALVKRQLEAYFAEVGVAKQLVDDMFALPFDDIRLLTRDELVDYGLYDD